MSDIPPRLTDRQTQCLRLAADGFTDQQIATHTGMSVGTVKTHIKRARHMLGAVTRIQAITLAHQQLYPQPCPCCTDIHAIVARHQAARNQLAASHPFAVLYDQIARAIKAGALTPDRRKAA